MRPFEQNAELANHYLREIDWADQQAVENHEPRQSHASRPAEKTKTPQDAHALNQQHKDRGHERRGIMRVVVDNDPETECRKHNLNEQQTISRLLQHPRQGKERDRKRGAEEKFPKIRGLIPPLSHGGGPTGLIQTRHKIVVEVVELRIGIGNGRLVVLPQENRSRNLPLLDKVRKNNRAARHSPVVKADEAGGAGENCSDGQNDAPRDHATRKNSQPKRPPQKRHAQRNEKNNAFDGPADRKNSRSQTKNDGVACTVAIPDSRQRSQNQGSTGRRHRSAPIAVHPVAEYGEPRPDEEAAEERPSRRRPPLQHPGERHAHGGDAQQRADPRLAEPLPDG